MTREGQTQRREHCKRSGLRGNQKMDQCRIHQMALHHQHQTDRAGLDGFVTAEDESELMASADPAWNSHRVADCNKSGIRRPIRRSAVGACRTRVSYFVAGTGARGTMM